MCVQEVAKPGAIVKILQVRALHAAEDQSWASNCFSVAIPPAECAISFCAVEEPTNLLERPQVLHIAAPRPPNTTLLCLLDLLPTVPEGDAALGPI